MAVGHYMLSGDFFENYEKSDSFFQLLDNPYNFKNYKAMVIDKKTDAEDISCHTHPHLVFDEMLAADSKRRAGVYKL